jgi:AraC-like DNA-binding protein
MVTVESARPSQTLSPYVRAYAQRKTKIAGAPIIEPVPPRLEQTLEFEFGDSFDVCFTNGDRITSPSITIIGWQSLLRGEIHLLGTTESFAIFFQPAGFSQLFGVPMTKLRNEAIEATSILGYEIRSVWNQMGEASSFSDRVAIIERFLRGLVVQAASADPITAAANCILSLRGVVGVDDLARQVRVSRRQFERRFLAQVGLTPKSFARIARFQTALDLKAVRPHKTWLDTAHELGYYDQMHLIHDFQKLTGRTPERLLGMLGDARPQALASFAPDD